MDNSTEQDTTHEAYLQQHELHDVGSAAAAFYGATQFQLSGGPDGSRLVLNASSEPILAGQGENEQAALADALQHMRGQETVRTPRSLVDVAMTSTAFVRLTTLEDYQPRIAPGSPIHQLPDYVRDMLRGHPRFEPETYERTVGQDGWQTEVHSLVSTYLSETADGQALAESLHIRSLNHLSPEQAVKLSTALVRNLSQYSLKDADRADQATAASLLGEGLQRRGDPSWSGNGVCRNIAANVRAVFEALKQTQAEPSMLNNTYCVCEKGLGGAGYADKRQDLLRQRIEPEDGHAWNTFVTVDSDGSAAVTKVDATWALGAPVDTIFHDLDRTDRRSVALVTTLFRRSERAAETFADVSSYLRSLVAKSRRRSDRGTTSERGFQAYVTTEWLRLAGSRPELRKVVLDAGTLTEFMDVANRISGSLDRSEIATLHALDTANDGVERARLKGVIKQYANQETPLKGEQEAERLLFGNTELQLLVYDAIGARITALSEQSGAFRARLRELEPHQLPAFDPEHSAADMKELVYIASSNGIHDKLPSSIMSALDKKLRAACPDVQTYQRLIDHNRGYRLASNFKGIMQRLRSISRAR